MSEEITVSQPVDLEGRNEKGQFAPGGKGKPKGSLQRITRAMKEQLAQELETAGLRGNPLVTLLRLSMDEEVHPAVRMQSADRLARFLAPRLLSIELETPTEEFEVETAKIRGRIRTLFAIPDQGEPK